MKKLTIPLCLALIFVLLNGISASVPTSKITIIRGFSASILERATRTHQVFPLNSSVTLTPLQSHSFYSSEGKKFFLTLRFNSPNYKIIGYSLYIYSKENFTAIFSHQDQWVSLWAEQPPAGEEVIDDFREIQFRGYEYCKLLGVMLNEPNEDLGDLIIETGAHNSFKFVFFTYILNW